MHNCWFMTHTKGVVEMQRRLDDGTRGILHDQLDLSRSRSIQGPAPVLLVPLGIGVAPHPRAAHSRATGHRSGWPPS